MPNSFVFDPNRCTGCHACRVACAIENELAPERSWRRVETFNARHHPGVPLFHLSLACNHCAEAACMHACPALAYRRDPSTGAVLLDEDKCIGCKYCAWACPFDAPVFDGALGVMSKCTFCQHRLLAGHKPACASLCPTRALDVMDLPESALVIDTDGFPVTNLVPRIAIAPLKPQHRLPVMSAVASGQVGRVDAEAAPAEISLRSEWSLMLFTTLAATLVALLTSAAAGKVVLRPLPFVAGAALTLVLAAMHLGRPWKAHRAVLNIRRSWLSREVLMLPAFFATATAYLWWMPGSEILAGLAVLLGFVALFCADQVYGVLERAGPGYRHSASVLWTGVFLTGVLLGSGWLAGLFGFGKMSLYIIRKLRFIELGRSVRPGISAARLALGFVLPLALWWLEPVGWRDCIIAAVLLGEIIDRGEYYIELERTSPGLAMREALEQRVADLADRWDNRTFAAAD